MERTDRLIAMLVLHTFLVTLTANGVISFRSNKMTSEFLEKGMIFYSIFSPDELVFLLHCFKQIWWTGMMFLVIFKPDCNGE